MAVLVYTLGTIGFSGANVFYDSLLPSLSNEETVDSVSSLGYAMGYLGGGILFLLNVVMTLNPSWFGLADAAEAVRWSFLTVALWWGCLPSSRFSGSRNHNKPGIMSGGIPSLKA